MTNTVDQLAAKRLEEVKKILQNIFDSSDEHPYVQSLAKKALFELFKPVESSSLVPIEKFEDFYYQMGEDFYLWNEEEQGEYPVERVFDAMKNFISRQK